MDKLGLKTKLYYSVGNLGYGTVVQTMNTFIMFFGTSVLGIRGSLVGIAVAISAFWDGLSDPILGHISDTHKAKFLGERQGYLLIGTIGMVIFNLLLWNVPTSFSEISKFTWLIVMLLGLETFSTCFITPYVALGIDIAPDYSEQSSVQGFKTIFFILGMILPSLLMVFLMPASQTAQSQLSQNGYINISYINSILCIICGLTCIFGTKKRSAIMPRYQEKKKEKNAFFKIFYNFILIFKRKNYRSIIISYSIANVAAAILTSVGMHLFTYCFHFNAIQIPILMACLFVGAILSQGFWIYISKRIDKKPTLRYSYITTLFGIFATFLVFMFREVLGVDYSFFMCVICMIFCGFGTGALYSLPVSMFADNINLDKIISKQDNSATLSGYLTFAYNVANSLALLVVGIFLDIIKFDSTQPVQALKVQNSLGLIVFLGCGIAITLAILTLAGYSLKRSDILKVQMKYKDK